MRCRFSRTPWFLILALAGLVETARGDESTVLLWPAGAPGAEGTEDADKPSLRLHLPTGERRTRTGVVVCPGGGYRALAVDHEGKQIAKWLNDRGIAAFVLTYRLAPRYHHPAPMLDAQRAMRYVRSHCAKFNIDPDKIGIWGFSAGGHLASTIATHFDAGDPNANDPIDKASCRPDFAILCYPVISLGSVYTHSGSRENLLGQKPDPKLVELLSNEKQVTSATPPTFLFHTGEDTAVPPENSIVFYEALRRAKVPVEMHIYEKGKHGVGLARNDPILSTWPSRLNDWLKVRGLLE